MTKNTVLTRLIEQEKLLYLEVEQMRYSLYLHDSSFIFGFFSAFYFAGQDIKNLFVKSKAPQIPQIKLKRRSIKSLSTKKNALFFLSNTPYAWIIYLLRLSKLVFLSFRSRLSRERNQASKSERKAVQKSFIIFGTTDVTDMQSRSLQIAKALSKKYKVIYIEGVFNERGKPGYQVVFELDKFIALRLSAKKSIHLNYQRPTQKEISFLKQSLKLVNPLTRQLVNPIIYIHHPFWTTIFSFKKNSYLFDHAENYTQNLNASIHIVQNEKKALKNAHIVTAPHKKLLRRKSDKVIQNAVEWDLFKDTSKMIQTCDVGLCWIKKPVLGYIGTLDERIDEKLLAELAAAYPLASIVLVGNTDYRTVIEVAEQYQNIFPVGKQPYKKLPLFLQSFDILITPFKYNKSGVTIHPELPLYLASGKPIISTAMSTYGVTNGAIYQPKSHNDWIVSISEALKEKKRGKKRMLRIAAAKKLVWKVTNLMKK